MQISTDLTSKLEFISTRKWDYDLQFQSISILIVWQINEAFSSSAAET